MKKTRKTKLFVQKLISLALCLLFMAVLPGPGAFAGEKENNNKEEEVNNRTENDVEREEPELTAAVAAGAGHTLALKDDGTVWAWGQNSHGQLGDGSTANRSSPVQVKGLSQVVYIAAGSNHSLALQADGTVWSWGNNLYGQLGDGTTENRAEPVEVKDIADIIQVTAGEHHSAALDEDGQLWTWGSNRYGQLGVGFKTDPATWSDELLSRYYREEVFDQETHEELKPQESFLSRIQAVSARGHTTLALTSGGAVRGWGADWEGQLGKASTQISRQILDEDISARARNRHTPVTIQGLSGITGIASGIDHTVALKEDGTVWALGGNSSGQLGDGGSSSTLEPYRIREVRNIAAVDAGLEYSLAVTESGMVWAWGSNRYGQLGTGNTRSSPTPERITPLSRVEAVAAGHDHAVALQVDGTVWAWGANWHGQLGIETTSNQPEPVQVSIQLITREEKPEPAPEPAPEPSPETMEIYVDSQHLTLKEQPVLREGRLFLPLRSIGETLDAQVHWEGTTRSVNLSRAGKSVSVTIGSATARVNGTETTLEDAPFLAEGRTFVPLRFFAEALGARVDWKAEENAVYIHRE